MADQPNTANPSFFRGMLPRKGLVSEAAQKIRSNMNGISLLKSVSIGSVVGVGIVAAKAAITGSFDASDLTNAGFVGGGAGLGVVHAVAHGVLENGMDGAAEAIHHNRTCNEIENALCQNPELAKQAALDRSAAYQFDHQPEPSRVAQDIIAQAEQRRASGMNASLAAQAPSAPGSRVL